MADEFVVVASDGGDEAECQLTLRRGWHQQHTLLALFFERAAASARDGDWIGLYDADADARHYRTFWRMGAVAHGFVSYRVPRAHFGRLHMRLMRADYSEVARSTALEHGPRLQLSAACEGDKLLVTWRVLPQLDDAMADDDGQLCAPGSPGAARIAAQQQALWSHASDWLGLFRVVDGEAAPADTQPADNKAYIDSLYITGDAATFARPAQAGLYEVRFFSAHRRYHCLSRVQVQVDEREEKK